MECKSVKDRKKQRWKKKGRRWRHRRRKEQRGESKEKGNLKEKDEQCSLKNTIYLISQIEKVIRLICLLLSSKSNQLGQHNFSICFGPEGSNSHNIVNSESASSIKSVSRTQIFRGSFYILGRAPPAPHTLPVTAEMEQRFTSCLAICFGKPANCNPPTVGLSVCPTLSNTGALIYISILPR